MRSAIVVCLGLGLVVGAVACKGDAASAAPAPSSAPAAPADPNARVVEVVASETGYSPSSIPAKVGESLVLRFKRTTQSECLKAVEFPSLGIKKDLPVGQAVDIPVKVDKAGEVRFQCWMAMVFGKIVVN